MANFHFDLVSPEKLLFTGDAEQVDLPGSEGDMGVLANHAPLVTTLRPGIIVVYRNEGDIRIVVNGGFAEVGPAGLTVLAAILVASVARQSAIMAIERTHGLRNRERTSTGSQSDSP